MQPPGAETPPPTILHLATCRVDLDRRIVHQPAPVPLTCRETDLLRYLAARPGRAVARDEVLSEAFGYSDQVLSRAVDCVVRRLRAKIEPDPGRPVHLLTDFGVGYRLSLPVAHPSPPLAPRQRALLSLAGGAVDLEAGTVHRPDGVVALVGNELALLRELVRTAGRPVDARALERCVWGQTIARSNRLRCLVWRLRKKIERDPRSPDHLVSQRRSGYRFLLPPAPRPRPLRRATVIAATVGPDATGEATERLWAAAKAVADGCGAEATHLALGQACLVLFGPGDGVGPGTTTAAAAATARLRAAIANIRIGVAEGEVRRIGTAGYVGRAVALATARAQQDARRTPPPAPMPRQSRPRRAPLPTPYRDNGPRGGCPSCRRAPT